MRVNDEELTGLIQHWAHEGDIMDVLRDLRDARAEAAALRRENERLRELGNAMACAYNNYRTNAGEKHGSPSIHEWRAATHPAPESEGA